MKNSNYNLEDASKREKLKLATKSKMIRTKSAVSHKFTRGRALSVIGKSVLVETEDDNNTIYNCVVSGRVTSPHKNTNIVAAGDIVHFVIDDNSENIASGRIIEIENRIRKFSRIMPGKGYSEHVIAANIDNILICSSVFDPVYNKRLIDRLLVGAELGLLKGAICINKVDLTDDLELFEDDLSIYRKLNIPVFFTSVSKNIGIDTLKDFLDGSSTLFFGQSGVGKSSLINAITGCEVQRIREVSERSGKGQHTTSFVKIIKSDNSYIVDSPGIREFALWDIDKLNLPFLFHDFDDYYKDCKYNPCSHIHEPDCAVIDALENDLIDAERYQSYVNIYNTLEDNIYL